MKRLIVLAPLLSVLACGDDDDDVVTTDAGLTADAAGIDAAAYDAGASEDAGADGGEDGGQVVGPPGWTLVWSDEFDGEGLLDPSRWDYEEGYVRNDELQYYTRARVENARLEGGNLVIEARRDGFEGHDVTSASVITRGKFEFLYGRIEVRAQIPSALGTWPAIWTLGVDIDDVGWPACGEIDIMENVGFDPETIYGTVHLTDGAGNHTSRGGQFGDAAPYDGFHVYAIEWFADHIDFFFDENLYFTFPSDEPGTLWAFEHPQYLLLNFAFGGAWGGQQGVDLDALPLQYLIDYVRIYTRA